MLPLALNQVSFVVNGRTIIDRISVQITEGPRTVILGPNGAGKSVLMRLCHGLLRPTSGTISWKGGVNGRRRQAMVFQRPVMLRRSALANIVYGLKLAGISPRECWLRAEDVLEAVGLANVARRPARVLSGGEQQRLAIARAWALGPEVMFLDEPTGAMDTQTELYFIEKLKTAVGPNQSLVVSTHRHNMLSICDRLIVIDAGRIIADGPRDEVMGKLAATVKKEASK